MQLQHEQQHRSHQYQQGGYRSDRRADVVANAAEHLARQRGLFRTGQEQGHDDLVERCREREQSAGDDAWRNQWQCHLEKSRDRVRAEARRGPYQVVVEALERRGDGRDDEWHTERRMGEDQPDIAASQAEGREEQVDRDARDDHGDDHGRDQDAGEQRLAGKLRPSQPDRGKRAQHDGE